MLRSRLAPTPSGYLHIGNAVNFIITWVVVRQAGGVLKLRIDDADAGRCRLEYIEDIFRQLDWLGLDWDEGPQGPDEFGRLFSQRLRFGDYRAFLDALEEAGHSYLCDCSRKQIRAQVANGIYPGLCRHKNVITSEGAHRLVVPENTQVAVADQDIALAEHMGDFVLWCRDDSPSYQLASLADDLADKTTLIVRGADLLISSAAQLFLAQLLQQESFAQITFHHHELLTCPQGMKLSKSDKVLSLQAMRQQGVLPLHFYQATASHLGHDPQGIRSLQDLLLLDISL